MGRAAAALLAVAGVREAVGEDATSLVLDGVVSNRGGASYTLGNTGSRNTLAILNGGGLTNVTIGYLGVGSSANLNTARVDGAGSVWQMSSDLYTGYSGDLNLLGVSGGGQVMSRLGLIGYNAGSESNSVRLSGAGTAWICSSNLTIGYTGAGNSLIVSNGAVVTSVNSYLGSYQSSNNSATVTGSGSVWSNRTMFVGGGQGDYGYYNTLSILDGGRMVTTNTPGTAACVGWYTRDNAVLVAGTGSTWDVKGLLYVGYSFGQFGHSNRLEVSDAATVAVASNLVVGRYNGATQCWISVSGGRLDVTNAVGRAALSIEQGSLRVDQGGVVVADALYVSNTVGTASYLALNSGAVTVRQMAVAVPGTLDIGDGSSSMVVSLLTGTNWVTGGVRVARHGVLDLNQAHLTGTVTVDDGGALLGGGRFGGAVTNLAGGRVAHAAGVGTNLFRSLALAGGSTNVFELGAGEAHDLTKTTNGLLSAGGGNPLIRFDAGSFDGIDDAVVLYDNLGSSAFDGVSAFFQLSDPLGPDDGAILGNDTSFRLVNTLGQTNLVWIRYDYDAASQTAGTGNDVALMAIPEPASLVILLGAILALRFLGRIRHAGGGRRSIR